MRAVRIPLIIVATAFMAAGCQTPGSRIEPASTPTEAVSVGPDNGMAALSVEEIATAAVATLNNNDSMRVRGDVPGEDGKPSLTFDLVKLNANEGRASVTIDGQTVEVMRVGGHDHAKADARFWATLGPPGLNSEAAAARANGKWVRANLFSADLGMITKFIDIPAIVWEAIVNDKEIKKGEERVVNGIPTIAFTSRFLGTVYLATQGEPHVVHVEFSRGGSLDFSEHHKLVVIEEPPADQIIDLAVVKAP